MRYAAALKVLAGVFGFGTLILIAGREWREATGFLVAGLSVGLLLWLAGLRGEDRRRAMRAEAGSLGLRYSSKDRFDLLDQPFRLLRWTRRSYGAIENVLWGVWGDRHVKAFDYAYVGTNEDRVELSCALVAINEGWPDLVIRPETFLTELGDRLAMPDVRFEWEAFNRVFDVRCEDRRFASALIDARMMEWLLGLGAGWGFEVVGPWLLGYRRRVQPWELRGVLETLATFLDKVPQAARSLYPASVPPRPDPVA